MLDDLIQKGIEIQIVCSHLFPQYGHVLREGKADAGRPRQLKAPGGRIGASDRLLLLTS
jgi:hypothetical protein